MICLFMHGITNTCRTLILQQEALALELKVLMMQQEKRSWELPSKMTGHLEMPLDGAAPKYVAGLVQQGCTQMQKVAEASPMAAAHHHVEMEERT
jgi:hypothetical protein